MATGRLTLTPATSISWWKNSLNLYVTIACYCDLFGDLTTVYASRSHCYAVFLPVMITLNEGSSKFF